MAGEMNHESLRQQVTRRLRWATSLRWSLLLVIGITLAVVFVWPTERTPWLGLGILTVALIIWLPSLVKSKYQRRLVLFSSQLLSEGRLQDAELSLRQALKGFTLATGPQLVGCHYMAVLAHAREQFAEAVSWCRTVLGHAQRSARGIRQSNRVLLADCLLSLDRLEEAYQALRPLYDQPLSLTEQLMLLPVQLRYELAGEHYDSAVADLPHRVRMAEMLSTRRSAEAHALLAVACQRTNRRSQAQFLWRRVRALGEDSVIQDYSAKMEEACPDNASSTPSA